MFWKQFYCQQRQEVWQLAAVNRHVFNSGTWMYCMLMLSVLNVDTHVCSYVHVLHAQCSVWYCYVHHVHHCMGEFRVKALLSLWYVDWVQYTDVHVSSLCTLLSTSLYGAMLKACMSTKNMWQWSCVASSHVHIFASSIHNYWCTDTSNRLPTNSWWLILHLWCIWHLCQSVHQPVPGLPSLSCDQ